MTTVPSAPSLSGRDILVTGGSGSFGHAFVQRALDEDARRVVVFSRSESKQAEMRAAMPDDRLRFVIGDVRDPDRVMEACRGIDILVHAAALKRVDTCEADPREAVATNVNGTANVIRACIERGVERAVFLSTDKAAAPATLYGSTKLVAERLWVASNVYSASTPTRFAATRYGNVLGSTGSVVPRWKAQAAAGEPLEITDCAATRFWMTMDEAVDLVVLAIGNMRGGEVFVPKIGSAPILDLARAIVERDGQVYAPGHIETSLRVGEKRHELLIAEDEARRTFDADTHYVIEPSVRTWGDAIPLAYPTVGDAFTYRSDTNPYRLSVGRLRELVAA